MVSVGSITIIGTVCCGAAVRDQATLFLVVAPLIIDMAMIGCWILDWVKDGT